MATKNSINNTSSELTIDPGASGDSFVQFDINGTGEFRVGVDDDASDSFKISQGSALGTTDTFIMTAAGERTMPLQPAFLAVLSETQNDVTGNNTSYSYICDTEIFDQGGDYNNSTGIFTAPVSGRYLFTATTYISDCTTTFFDLIYFQASSRPAFSGYSRDSDSADMFTEFTFFVDLDISDTIYPQTRVNGEGADTCDLEGVSGSETRTTFSGHLVC